MTNTMTLATTIALTAFSFGMGSLPANAFDFSSILQSLSHGVSGWTELDARESEIGSQLSSAAASGQLSTAEADGFRFELTRVMQVEAQIKASGRQLSATDAISFTNSLNNLTNRINIAIASKNNSTAVSVAAVETLRTQLKAQIDQARRDHTITRTDFESINRDLEHNADIQSAFSGSGDSVSERQARVLSDDLARIRFAVTQHITVAQTGTPQLALQRAALEKRINAGIASRNIGDKQAKDFKADLLRIANMQRNFLSYDGVLSGNEVIAVAGELDRLNTRVDYQISLGRDDYGRGNGYGQNHSNNYGRNHRSSSTYRSSTSRSF